MTDGQNTAEKEAVFGLLPVLPSERTWNFFDFANVNVGLAIATWCFLIGGTMSLFVDLKMGIIAAFAGNTVAILIMAAATTIPSCKYGIDQYTSLRSVFGVQGTKVALLSMIFVEFLWATVLSIMFGRAMQNIYEGLSANANTSGALLILFALIAIVTSWLVVWKGPVTIQLFNRIVAPGLAIVMIIMAALLIKNVGFTNIWNAQPLEPSPNSWWNFMIAFELNLGAGFSWWPIMGGLTRLTTNTRAAFWPNQIGINLAAVIGTMIGLASALCLQTSDPTEWMIPLGGITFGVLTLLFVAFANITSIMSIAYSSCLALKQVKVFLDLDWGKLTAFFFAFPAILAFFPYAIYNNFDTFLAVCATFFGPLSGIYFVDYFILRKQELNLRHIYNLSPSSGYYFWGGINWVAVICFVISIPLYYLFLDPITFESSRLFLWFTASIPSTVIASILYYLLMTLLVLPNNLGCYRNCTKN